jgi:hypothetical protein
MTTLTPERIEEIRSALATLTTYTRLEEIVECVELRALLDVWVAAVSMAETYKSPGEDTAHRRLQEALGGKR